MVQSPNSFFFGIETNKKQDLLCSCPFFGGGVLNVNWKSWLNLHLVSVMFMYTGDI